ncbi:MAG: tetratricopeptide repeat protein [Microthrixaceae bacterium]
MSATPGRSRGHLDPDELALLEEERDHLLRSLEDLEREHDAGDMDDLDHATLKDDYTVRAAEVLRSIEERREVLRSARPAASRTRNWLVAAGVLAFAVVAGVLVARESGQRGDNAITGSTGTLRERLATCQTTSFQEPAKGIDCYDDILEEAPDQIEALTYQGWAMVREGRVADGAANFDRVVELDPDYPDVRVFRASVAATAGEYDLAAIELDQFYANDPSTSAVQVLRSQGLERKVFFGLLDPRTAACWTSAAEQQGAGGSVDQAFLDSLSACLDDVLVATPDDVDALVSLALAKVGPQDSDLPGAIQTVGRAVALDPQDPDALLLQASLAAADQRYEDAAANLELLAGLPRPTISFLIGGPEALAEQLESVTGGLGGSAGASSTTSTTPPNAADPGAAVPNPGGG